MVVFEKLRPRSKRSCGATAGRYGPLGPARPQPRKPCCVAISKAARRTSEEAGPFGNAPTRLLRSPEGAQP
eukprot:11175068-Lingulodinium_polyedra.AAC.1